MQIHERLGQVYDDGSGNEHQSFKPLNAKEIRLQYRNSNLKNEIDGKRRLHNAMGGQQAYVRRSPMAT